MIQEPLRVNAARQAVIRSHSTPAPVGGWNTRDSLAAMPENDAIVLDNFFPESSSVRTRKGFSSYATGFVAAVETLMVYGAPTAQEMFACAGSGIFDVSASGAIGAAVVTGVSEPRHSWVNFGNAGAYYLICCNGANAVRSYNGTTWALPSITNVSASTLIQVHEFKSFLFFVEKDTLSAWYLPTGAIAGAALELDFAPYCRLGGYLVAMGTWTRDSGSGMDDLAVWVTSRGEVIIYQGTDPGASSTWALVGVFQIGEPIGRDCFLKLGSDLIIITRDGFTPLSRVISGGRVNQGAALSDKISSAVNEATRLHGALEGWQAHLYPRGKMALFNVPQSSTVFHQYIVNTITGAWCRFKGQNAYCWAIYNDLLYFGGASSVFLADDGLDDNGANIQADAKTSFSALRAHGRLKRFTQIRPLMHSEGKITPAIALNVDYADAVPTSIPTFTGSAGTAWDTAPWDISPWGSDPRPLNDWLGVSGLGYVAALRMRTALRGVSAIWYSTDWLFEPGGYI